MLSESSCRIGMTEEQIHVIKERFLRTRRQELGRTVDGAVRNFFNLPPGTGTGYCLFGSYGVSPGHLIGDLDAAVIVDCSSRVGRLQY